MQSITASLIAFTGAATLLTITPGLDTAFVVRTGAAEGPRSGMLAALGILTGCLVWAIIVAAGLGVLLAASQLAYTILRWVGAAYLVFMGYRLLRDPRSAFSIVQSDARLGHAAFARGAWTNLLNPKVGIFYVSFLPQFIPNGLSVPWFTLLLGVIHAFLGAIWFACLLGAMRPLMRVLQRASIIKTLDRATGALFIAFGIGLAVQSRRT